MSNIKASKPVPSLEEINAKLQTKVLELENKILRLENRTLKQEQKIIKLTAENIRLKEMKTPVNISISGFDSPPGTAKETK